MTVPSRVLARCLVVLGLLLTQGSMLFHLLLVPHVTCEHGELVDKVGREQPRPTDEASAKPSSTAIERSDAPSSEHDHCDMLALRHRVPEVATPVAEASLLAVLPLEATSEGSEVRAVPLLALRAQELASDRLTLASEFVGFPGAPAFHCR